MTNRLLLIENARLFDPEPCGVAQLLIGAGTILQTGPKPLRLPAELDCERFDAGGARVVPGFVDLHAHITGGGGEQGPGSRIDPLQVEALFAAGITTVCGLLGTDDITRDTAGLLAQTRALTDRGLSAYCYTGGYHLPPTTLTGSVSHDLVFIPEIVGLGELAISDHRSSQPTLEQLLNVAGEVHVGAMLAGKPGVVHLHLGNGPRGLELIRRAIETSELPARLFHPTHCNRRKRLFQEALELARSGCTIDVTAFPDDDDDTDAWNSAAAVERFWAAEIPPDRLTISSDCGGSLPCFDDAGRLTRYGVAEPRSLPLTLAKLVERGAPLERALLPFTANPARLLGLERKGSLKAGADADLLLLDDSHLPLRTMTRGRWRN